MKYVNMMTTVHRDVALRVIDLISQESVGRSLSLHDALNILLYALNVCASGSRSPGEFMDNALAVIAQSTFCEGRELPTAVLRKCTELAGAGAPS